MSTDTTGIAQPLARYAAWRRAGDLVFLSGVIAVDPGANRIVLSQGGTAPVTWGKQVSRCAYKCRVLVAQPPHEHK